jgi:adenosylhomocysteine nucleosidase
LSRLGIIVAVTAEARSLTKAPIAEGGLIRLPEGAVVNVSGIGPKRAASAARLLLGAGATALLSWGSAGGLSPDLPPGSLILPRTIIASDHSQYPVDTGWHNHLCNLLKGRIKFHTDPLVESARVICTPVEKELLFRRTGAVGVDMESAAVAGVAAEAGVSFIAVRAVADSLDTAIPQCTLDAFDEFGQLHPFRLILGLAGHPTELRATVRIARTYRAAHQTLASVVRLAGNKLFDSRNTTKEGP